MGGCGSDLKNDKVEVEVRSALAAVPLAVREGLVGLPKDPHS